MKHKFLFLIFTTVISGFFLAQDNKEIAFQKGNEAVKIMDEGKIEESILLLQECQKLDPENFNYPYEIAYANYLKEDYKKSIEILEKLENYKNINARLYTLWGNSYDNLGEPKKAIAIYDLGIEKFPNKGLLYLEKGVVYELEKEYDKAVETYQKGISVEPKYPSNYYRLANLFLNSSDRTPGLVYGEIFINLERTTDRTKEISKKLFDTYKKAVVFENNHWIELNFCKEIIIDGAKFENDKKLPFCMVFGQNYISGLIATSPKEINLDTLSRIREAMIKSYFKKDVKDYPNFLFDYHNQMIDHKVFDAYNRYIFQMGAENEFADWRKTNEPEYKKFVEWYTKDENIISPTEKNYWNFTN